MALTGIEREIAVAVRRSPRASYAALASEVGLDERTVRRTLDRLREDRTITFSAAVLYEHHPGWFSAQIEIHCRPSANESVAEQLSSRPDTRFVATTTGDCDVVADIVAQSAADLHRIVSREIGSIEGVHAMRTQVVMNLLLTAVDWDPDGRVTQGREQVINGARHTSMPPTMDDIDIAIADALNADVRAPLSALAGQVQAHESTIQRRLTRLVTQGGIELRADVSPEMLGYGAETRFKLSMRPDKLDEACRLLAAEPCIRALYTTTGPSNVLGYAVHSGAQTIQSDLFDGPFSRLTGLLSSDVSMILHSYKRSGQRYDGN